tara:strand:- start:186 stop:452 length:267 start_codon:yes stop_codon:yes gene_type:complete
MFPVCLVAASKTAKVAVVTSIPMPSPGKTQIRKVAPTIITRLREIINRLLAVVGCLALATAILRRRTCSNTASVQKGQSARLLTQSDC